MDIARTKAYIKASSHFLTEEYPSNWEDMTEEGLLQFISDHEWEYFEDVEPEEVAEHIHNLAVDFVNFSFETQPPPILPESVEEE